MKKKVRIYKAPDGKGKFVNKTAKFLYGGMPKAQEGMQADPMAAMADYVYKTLDDIEFFEDTDEVKESLIDELTTANVPIEKAEELVNNIAGQVLLPKFPEAQSEQTEEITESEPEAEESETETDYGYYDDTVANEEDEEDYDDDDDIPEEVYMQSGGDLIPKDNAVTFTGYDAGNYVEDKQQMYALGGMTKRKYIGNVMKMLKKAEEGIEAQSEEEGPTDFDPTDTMDKKKEDRNKGFVSALASSAIEAKRKEQAEAMWKQQQELMAQEPYPEMTPEGDPMARRGFATGEEYLSPRQIRRMMPRGLGRNQMSSFAGWVPPGGMFPGGINIMTMPQANMQMPEQKPIHVQGSMPGMKIDVRKSHWLTGKPSQYSIEYGGDGAIPGFGMMPGIGYGSRSTTRRTIEGVSRLVNKNADPAKNNTTVLNNNPEKDKSNPDNAVADQSTVVKGADGNPIISDGSNMTWDKPSDNKSISPTVGESYGDFQKRQNPGAIFEPAMGKGGWDQWKSTWNGSQWVSASGQVYADDNQPITSSIVNNATTENKSTTANPNKDAVGTGAKLPAKNSGNKVTTNTSSKNAGQNKPAASAKVTNKGKATVTSSDLINKQKKSGWSNSMTGSGTQPSSYDVIPQWMKDAVNNNESNESESSGSTWDMIKSYYPLTKILFEQGGFVDSSNPDLYEFIYGGADPITQQDMNYSDSKNTGSPFFAQDGGSLKRYDKGDEVKEDEYTTYLKGKAESEALDEYNKFMNRTEKDQAKFKKFDANTNDAVYNRILTENRKKYNIADPNENSSSDFRAKNPTSAINPKTGKQWTWEEWDAPGGGGYEARQKEDAEWKRREQEESNNQGNTYNPYGYGSNFQPNMFQKYVPFNTRRKIGTWSRQVGMPYDPRTGQMVNAFGPNTNLTKIDVRKSGWLSRNPKKYTMYFNNYNVDPKLAKFLEETHGADPSKQPVKDKSKVAEDIKVTKPEDSNVVPGYEPGAYGPGFSGYNADSDGDGVPDFMQTNDPQDGKRKPFKIGDPLSPSGPSAEEIAARDAATEANKDVIRNFSEVEGVQDDPFGIGTGGPSEEPSDFEESTKTYDSPEAANEYIQGEWGDIMADVSEVLGPKSQQEFDKFLATNPTKGAIDAKIEDFMRQRNEVIYKDAEAVEREDLTANAEEEIMNQQAMRRNPMFMGSSGAPAANPNFGAKPMIATGSGEDPTNYQDYGYGYGAPGPFEGMTGAPLIAGASPWKLPNSFNPDMPISPMNWDQWDSSNSLLSSFPQYTDAFEGAASNDEQYLPGTFNNLTEGSIRNKEIAAKQLYNQQQAAIRQQQLIQQQQEKQKKEGTSNSGSGSGSNTSSNAALKEKAFNSNRQAKQSGNWTDTWDIKGLINANKDQLETLKGSPNGYKTLFAIDTRWQNMTNAQRKTYGNFDNYLKVEGYDKFYNTMHGKTSQIAKAKKKKENSVMEFATDWLRNMGSKQYGGNLDRFNPGGPITYEDWTAGNDKNNNGISDILEAGSTTNSINLNSNFAPKKDDQGNVIIPGFNTAESQQNDKMKNSLLSYQGYGEGDEFSAAPEGSAVTVDDQGNPIVMSPDEAYRRMKEGEIAVDMENEDTYEVDSEGELGLFNYIGNAGLGKVGRYQAMQPFKNFYTANFNTDNITASQDRRDRGVYDTNTGLYKPNKQGPTDTNTTVSRYGGFMQMGGWTEGDVVEMTPEEYAEFLANGGELEIID